MGFKLDCLVELKFHGRLNFHFEHFSSFPHFHLKCQSDLDLRIPFCWIWEINGKGGWGRQSLMSPLKREKIVSGVPYGRRLLSSVHFSIFSSASENECNLPLKLHIRLPKRRAKVAWPAVNLAEKWRRWNQWNGDGAGQSAALFVRCCRSHSRRLDLLKWDIAVGTDINVLPLSRPLPLATISSSWNPRYRGIQSNYKTRIKFFSRLPRYLLHNSKLLVKTMSANPS